MTNQIWWYTARAGGIVAWALLAMSVLWGLALSTKVLNGKPRPNWILDLHRFLGALALVFTGVHVVAIVADSYVHFGLTEVLVPLTGTWHPVAVAWGIIGAYFLVAVEVTSLLRRRLSKRLWRATHFLSFPLFALDDGARAVSRHRQRHVRAALGRHRHRGRRHRAHLHPHPASAARRDAGRRGHAVDAHARTPHPRTRALSMNDPKEIPMSIDPLVADRIRRPEAPAPPAASPTPSPRAARRRRPHPARRARRASAAAAVTAMLTLAGGMAATAATSSSAATTKATTAATTAAEPASTTAASTTAASRNAASTTAATTATTAAKAATPSTTATTASKGS